MSSSSSAAGGNFAHARSLVSFQAVGAVVLSAAVIYQAGRQSALERKIAQLETALGKEEQVVYAAALQQATGHKYSVTQRVAEGMLGPGAKFGDLLVIGFAFPCVCVCVGAISTRASQLVVGARAKTAAAAAAHKKAALQALQAKKAAVAQQQAATVATEVVASEAAVAAESASVAEAAAVAESTAVAETPAAVAKAAAPEKLAAAEAAVSAASSAVAAASAAAAQAVKLLTPTMLTPHYFVNALVAKPSQRFFGAARDAKAAPTIGTGRSCAHLNCM